ncbi:hypothetical protein [uncultured Psychrosphaera sp.]|uniref:hypothetical protein n=1 Tax=uncultured Psychrosphaera sp. TaxID=1403522 RepID=UPI00262E6623|nr:hypothetical protein [uncultured Psychrosphaera sp.]
MNFSTLLTTLFALVLTTSVNANSIVVTDIYLANDEANFDAVIDEKLTSATGSPKSTVTISNLTAGEEVDFSRISISTSSMLARNNEVSANKFISDSNSFSNIKTNTLLKSFGIGSITSELDSIYNGSRTEDEFSNNYLVSKSVEMNELEIGVSYVANLTNRLSYNVYLGYVSGEIAVNEALSAELTYKDNYSALSFALKDHIENNTPTQEGILSRGTPYSYQNYQVECAYTYIAFPTLNLNSHGSSNTIDFATMVIKLEADFALTNDFSILAGLASEGTKVDNINTNIDGYVYNIAASYSILERVGVEFNHKIYDQQSKTSVALNYAF